MKLILYIISLLTICSIAPQEFNLSQNSDRELVIYQTYSDYKEDSGKILGSYVSFAFSTGIVGKSYKIKYVDNVSNKKRNVQLKKYWGFKIGDMLFRVDNKSKRPMRVMNIGKYIYYELGIIHIRTLSTGLGWDDAKTWVYFSNNLETKIMPYKKFKKSIQNNSQSKQFCDCLDEADKKRAKPVIRGNINYQEHITDSRSCVEEYNQ